MQYTNKWNYLSLFIHNIFQGIVSLFGMNDDVVSLFGMVSDELVELMDYLNRQCTSL